MVEKKMSKSDLIDFSRINLCDHTDVIADKIRRAVTDSIDGISYDPEKRPGTSNLVSIYSAISCQSIETVVQDRHQLSHSQFKAELIDLIVTHLCPIRQDLLLLRADRSFLLQVLNDGRERALNIATSTMQRVNTIMGLSVPFQPPISSISAPISVPIP